MTRFDPKKQHKSEIDWTKIAWKTVDQDNAAQTFVLGLVVGVAITNVTTPLLGGVIGCYFFVKGIQKSIESDKNRKYIKEAGCVAHVLDDGDFRAYLNQVGSEGVISELQFASQNDLSFSNEATDFYEDYLEKQQQSVALLPPAKPETVRSAGGGSASYERTLTRTLSQSISLELPIQERANAVINKLIEDGFKIDEIMCSQVIAIAGTQRGGKGTLAAILATLSKALDPNLNVLYFTAGIDIYPFDCVLHSALKYPNLPSDQADERVAQSLFHYLKGLDGCEPYSHKNLILVIDEAMKLFSHLEELDRSWAIEFLLCRFGKTGATLIIVLHASNLGAIVGSKNTEGLADTFKQSVSFIGCVAQSVSAGGLRKINVASGEYFKANPNNFGSPIANGELGAIPEWLKVEKHPGNGYPDPARTLLKIFPELETTTATKVQKLERLLNIEAPEPEIKDSPAREESIEPLEALTDHEMQLLNWMKTRKLVGEQYDLETANKNLEKIVKPDNFSKRIEYIRHLARELETKKKGALKNPNQFEPN